MTLAAVHVPGVHAPRRCVPASATSIAFDRPGVREALAACRAPSPSTSPQRDRLARSLADTRHVVDELTNREAELSLGGWLLPGSALGWSPGRDRCHLPDRWIAARTDTRALAVPDTTNPDYWARLRDCAQPVDNCRSVRLRLRCCDAVLARPRHEAFAQGQSESSPDPSDSGRRRRDGLMLLLAIASAAERHIEGSPPSRSDQVLPNRVVAICPVDRQRAPRIPRRYGTDSTRRTLIGRQRTVARSGWHPRTDDSIPTPSRRPQASQPGVASHRSFQRTAT